MNAMPNDDLTALVDKVNGRDPATHCTFCGSPFDERVPGYCVKCQAFPTTSKAMYWTEQEKYTAMWSHEQYRGIAPGEQIAPEFLNIARPRNGAKIIDFGAGTGRGSRAIAILANLAGIDVDIDMLDFASNALDEDVAEICKQDGTTKLRFTQHDLTKPVPIAAEYGFCTDVMEHIPPEQVDLVLTNILQAARHVFFQISCVDDACGKLIGHPLHLSVHEPTWWKAKLEALGCTIHYWRDDTESCIAYVTAWTDGQDIVDVGMLNIAEEAIRNNVRTNIGPQFFDDWPWEHMSDAGKKAAFHILNTAIWSDGKPFKSVYDGVQGISFEPSIIEGVKWGPFPAKRVGSDNNEEGYIDVPAHDGKILYWWGNSNLYWPISKKEWLDALKATGGEPFRWHQVMPHAPQSTEVMILGGGPSLAGQLDTIRRMRFEGKKLVTLNGAYNWAIEHGLEVSAQIVVDARPHNARFTKPVQPNTIYLMGSQVDPSVLEGLPKERTLLWHTTAEAIRDILEEECPGKWFGVPGGSTVLLRAIPLLRMLGYSRFHLFGCDSCVMPQHDGNFTSDRSKDVALPPLHHAYSQPENDGVPLFPATVGGRVFHCTAWNIAQAQEFMNLIRVMGDMFELEVHGDGLLAWILQHGAQVDIERELKQAMEANGIAEAPLEDPEMLSATIDNLQRLAREGSER